MKDGFIDWVKIELDLQKNKNKLNYNESIDSIHIKIYGTTSLKIIDEYIRNNELIKFSKKNTHNKYSRVIIRDKNTILFSYYKQTFKDFYLDDYVMIEVHGFKKYSKYDEHKNTHYINLLQELNKNQEQYDVQKLDYSIDINQSTEHIFLYKNSKGKEYNSLMNFNFKSTDKGNYRLEKDSTDYSKNRKDRLTMYDKQQKEDLDETKTRIEISLLPTSFRKIRKKDDSSHFLDFIKEEISKYKIYYFDDVDTRNKCIEYYESTNFSISNRVLKKLDKKYLSDSTKIECDFNSLEDFFCNF